jgi:hypothetical protein
MSDDDDMSPRSRPRRNAMSLPGRDGRVDTVSNANENGSASRDTQPQDPQHLPATAVEGRPEPTPAEIASFRQQAASMLELDDRNIASVITHLRDRRARQLRDARAAWLAEGREGSTAAAAAGVRRHMAVVSDAMATVRDARVRLGVSTNSTEPQRFVQARTIRARIDFLRQSQVHDENATSPDQQELATTARVEELERLLRLVQPIVPPFQPHERPVPERAIRARIPVLQGVYARETDATELFTFHARVDELERLLQFSQPGAASMARGGGETARGDEDGREEDETRDGEVFNIFGEFSAALMRD